MRAVQPHPHKLFSGHAFALRDLGLMMRKDIVYTAAMDVDLIAEERGRHRAALDVPAGTSRSPWRIPFHIAIFFVPRFPKCEVADVFFVVLVMFHAASGPQYRQIKMCELSIIRKFVDPKIDRFVVSLISETFGTQRADHRDYFLDVTLIGRGGITFRSFDP